MESRTRRIRGVFIVLTGSILFGVSIIALGFLWPRGPSIQIQKGEFADLTELSSRYPSVGCDLTILPFSSPLQWAEVGRERGYPKLYIWSKCDARSVSEWRKEAGVSTTYLEGGMIKEQDVLAGKECLLFVISDTPGRRYNIYIFNDRTIMIVVSGDPERW